MKKLRPRELTSANRGRSVVDAVNKIILSKLNDIAREESQLSHTSKELVCALGWVTFPKHVMSVSEKKYVYALFSKVGYTLRNKKKDPNYAFTLNQKLLLADTSMELRYYEGFMQKAGELHYHSWLTFRSKLVDLASNAEIDYLDNHVTTTGQFGNYADDLDYAGREIPKKLVFDLHEETKSYLPILQRYDYVYGDVRAGKITEAPI